VFNFKERLEQFENDNSQRLVRHAYSQQKTLQLTWYKSLDNVQKALESEKKEH
jgi:predicted GIY-YIG superfamily endonuclease